MNDFKGLATITGHLIVKLVTLRHYSLMSEVREMTCPKGKETMCPEGT